MDLFSKEFVRWDPSLDISMINLVHTGKDDPTIGSVNILSYDLVPKHTNSLAEKRFKIVIAVSRVILNPLVHCFRSG